MVMMSPASRNFPTKGKGEMGLRAAAKRDGGER